MKSAGASRGAAAGYHGSSAVRPMAAEDAATAICERRDSSFPRSPIPPSRYLGGRVGCSARRRSPGPGGARRRIVHAPPCRPPALVCAAKPPIFQQRLDVAARPFLRFGVAKPRLIIRALARRWGSYTATGNLVLNRDLVRASPHLIDYVVTHELAHAVHPDHRSGWQNRQL